MEKKMTKKEYFAVLAENIQFNNVKSSYNEQP